MRMIDTRGLVPPEPFEQVIEALADLAPQTSLVVCLDRMPHPLLRILDRDGYRHHARLRADGAVEVEITAP